ncbi:MAG: rane-bound dehydrogenase protein [Chthoniobacteraceae bacterium]|nr:rane-bound dehydrogenase protein [Chthoniobacteraceae bacterium]
MKKPIPSLLLAAFLSSAAYAAPGPIRVLYLGNEGSPTAKHCAVLMRELGRDAIWLDYTADTAAVTKEWLGKFDAVLLDGRAAEFKALAGWDQKRVVTVEFNGDEKSWGNADFLAPIREKLLAAVGEVRQSEYSAFLAGREVEKRESSPDVANYEKRPQPLTYQFPFNPKGSAERTQVPPDMRLELFAGEPDITKPIAFAWDERGRLWVAETRDYPHGVVPGGDGHDDIKICEDTDGDGRADKFTIFADKLNLPTSLVFANGGIMVSQAPRFLFLKDTDGDDKADVREIIMQSWGVQDTHAQASNLHYGLDNWLYGCVGYSGFKGVVGGKMHDFGMGTYRFKADGSTLEFLHQFSNNSWAQSINAAGDQFGGTANNAPIFYGGIPAGLAPAGMRLMTAKRINIEDKAHAITPNFRQVDVMGGYTAAAGSAFIYSSNLPARFQGKAMVCEPTMKLISLMDVQPEGAGYIAKDGFNLVASSDEWMSPVFSEVGPDGAVWFADWENFIIQHNPTPSVERGGYAAKTGPGGAHENALRDHEHGRIYRVVWEKAAKPAITSLQGASIPELVKALGSDTQFWRLTAQRLLVDGKKIEAADALRRLVMANDGAVGAIHALWTLQGLGLLDDATHKAAFLARDAALRRNAIRALGIDERSQSLLYGSGVVSDPDAHTRLAAMVKLAELPTTNELQTLVLQLNKEPIVKSDEWLREAGRLLAKKHHAQPFREGPNLLPNSGFETIGVDGLPEGWTRRDYNSREGSLKAKWESTSEEKMLHSGAHAVRCITYSEGDTSLYANVSLKPHTQYRLSGWVKTHALRGRASLNDHIGKHETDRVTSAESGWVQVESIFESGEAPTASINILHVAKGESHFDDVRLCELLPEEEEKLLAGDIKRGEQLFLKHPTAACVVCHSLRGAGGTVGPLLDGIATRKDAVYIKESLLEPNKVLAEGFAQLGASPMPPMGLILKPQELEDIQAYLQTLK